MVGQPLVEVPSREPTARPYWTKRMRLSLHILQTVPFEAERAFEDCALWDRPGLLRADLAVARSSERGRRRRRMHYPEGYKHMDLTEIKRLVWEPSVAEPPDCARTTAGA